VIKINNHTYKPYLYKSKYKPKENTSTENTDKTMHQQNVIKDKLYCLKNHKMNFYDKSYNSLNNSNNKSKKDSYTNENSISASNSKNSNNHNTVNNKIIHYQKIKNSSSLNILKGKKMTMFFHNIEKCAKNFSISNEKKKSDLFVKNLNYSNSLKPSEKFCKFLLKNKI